MNTISFTIDDSSDGLSIKQFLRGRLAFSMHQISRIKYRPDGFLVNGKPRWVNHILRAGDILTFSLDDKPENLAESENVLDCQSTTAQTPENAASTQIPQILYEDSFLLVADKPSGMVSHPSHGHRGDSALSILERIKGQLYLIGRLDKDTSGVLLFAKQKETASVLTRNREDLILEKIYLAAVHGKMDPPCGCIAAPIGIEKEFPLKMKIDPEHGKEAVTHYETLRTRLLEDGGQMFSVALLKIHIEHGRTHQIRVHLASIGHPLIGDPLYGTEQPSYAHLHAALIALKHPFTGETIRAKATLPAWADCDTD